MNVSPKTASFVRETGCAGCPDGLTINKGLPMECLRWTEEESSIFRIFMTEDNELFASGFVTKYDKSILGNKTKIVDRSVQVGNVRTQAGGVTAVNECGRTFNPVTFNKFEKTFYTMSYELNPQLCPRNLIGTTWQEQVGGRATDFDADKMEGTMLGEILVMKVIEMFKRTMPKTFLLGVYGSADPQANGDDGIFAKAYYARLGQHFDTRSYAVPASGENINAIVGGKRYEKAAADFATTEQYILDFVSWLNNLRYTTNELMLDASVSFTEGLIYVVSTIAIREIDLRIVYTDDVTIIDWGCQSTYAEETPFTQYSKQMQFNDVPLLYQFEAITGANFFPYFTERLKEYHRYIKVNSERMVSDSDIKIGIDPMLMLERNAWLNNKTIECCDDNGNTATQLGLGSDRFVPLEALSNTGLFFITTMGNFWLLSDEDNATELSNFRFRESKTCDQTLELISDFPLIGNTVKDFGLLALNILDSPFVINNDLDNRDPNEFSKLQLACYDSDVVEQCAVKADCSINANATIVAAYDGTADETSITVTVNATPITGATYAYALNYSMSDGTSNAAVITDASFVVTVPGDQTNSGLVITVNGQVEATTSTGGICNAFVNETERFGEVSPATRCVTVAFENTGTGSDIGSSLQLLYSISGVTPKEDAEFQDSGLSLASESDFAAISDEIEAILPGTYVEISVVNTITTTITINNVPSYITAIELYSDDTDESVDIITPCA